MTTTAIAANGQTASAPTAVRRTWNVVRLHVANPFPTLIMPWIITFAIFALNMAIFLLVIRVAGGQQNLGEDAFAYSGGITWIVFFMTVVAVQTMNLNFSFALGFSVTRRDFYLGSALYFVILSLLYGTGVAMLAVVERVTDGWGIGAAFFAPWGLAHEPLVTVWAVYVLAMLFFFFLGAAVATTWVRWRAYGLYAFFLGLAVVLVGIAWLITATDGWAAVGDFLANQPMIQLVAWSLPVTAASAIVGYLFIRRATPRA